MSATLQTLGDLGTTHIFTHHITSAVDIKVLKAFLPAYNYFDQRAFLLARPNDVVCDSLSGCWEPKCQRTIMCDIRTQLRPAFDLQAMYEKS